MTPSDDTATAPVSSGEGRGDAPVGLSAIAWVAERFDRPYSAAAVLARVPQGLDLTSGLGLARALASIGIKSKLIQRKLDRIDPIALPCLMLRKGQAPLVVTAITGKTAEVVDPDAPHLTQEVPLRKLRRMGTGAVMLITRAEDPASGRLSPEAAALASARGHWFWSPVRANWPNWTQVLVAAFLLNLLSLALPLFVMNVYDRVIPNLAYVTLTTLAVGVGIALAIDLMMRTIRGNLLDAIGRRVDLRVAADLFSHALHARLLDRPGGAAGIASTIRDFEVVREFFASATFVAVIDLAFIGIFVAALWMIVGPIALVPLLAVPIVLILALAAQLPLGRAAARAQAMATKRHVVLVEALGGIETIKSLGAEPLMQREWEAAVTAASQVNGRTRFWSNIAAHGTVLIQQAVSVLIIVWGVFLVADGRITIGGLIAANILAGRVLAPLGTVAQTIFRAQYAFKSLGALNRFMELPVEQSPAIASGAQVTKCGLRLQDIQFRYPGTARPALDGLSLAVEPGESVAILGKVGCGKSTLGKLVAGLLPPASGQVLIDGIAQGQYDPSELRRGVGYLPQTPELFTGTLRENLTLGAPGASDPEVAQALYHAGMDEFVAGLPEGLDLHLGEAGQRLSGGQRQGIALARLLLRQPKLLYLDEPTNAMDQRLQSLVTERLAALNQTGVGLILCTHRQSLADMAVRVVVMDQGRVILDGQRNEVLTRLRAMRDARTEGARDVR